MRALIPLAMLLGIWIGFGAPVPFLASELPADPALATYAEAKEEGRRQAAMATPTSGENPERRELRKAVLRAAMNLDSSPCNASYRKQLVAAAKPFLRSIEEGPREVAVVNGKKQEVSKKFDKPAVDKIFEAMMKGHLDPRDLGSWPGRMMLRGAPAAKPRC
ncbi:MAG TPA: hypothetical protein VKP12_15740 [Kiloniellaceae bacterium]|nr:hypothetical protein [Kiloniellaceae bacterium]